MKHEVDYSDDTALNYRRLYRLTEKPNALGFWKMDISLGALYRIAALNDDERQAEVINQVTQASRLGHVTSDIVLDIIEPPRCKSCGKSEQEVSDSGHTLTGTRFFGFQCTECKAEEGKPPPDDDEEDDDDDEMDPPPDDDEGEGDEDEGEDEDDEDEATRHRRHPDKLTAWFKPSAS